MKKDMVNPFAACELRIPADFLADVKKFTATFSPEDGREPDPDRTPFRRYVDIWWVGLGIGVGDNRRIETPPGGWHKFMDGLVLQSDPWRVTQLQMLGLAWAGGSIGLADPGKIIAQANEYAAHGIEVLLSAMVGKTEPIWAVSELMKERCAKDLPEKGPDAA